MLKSAPGILLADFLLDWMRVMILNELTALSPLDGRYAARVNALRDWL